MNESIDSERLIGTDRILNKAGFWKDLKEEYEINLECYGDTLFIMLST